MKGIAAGGRDEDRIHPQGGGTPEDGPHVGGIHDALQHRHPAGIPAHLLRRRNRGALHGAQDSSGQRVPRQGRQQFPVSRVHRHIPAAADQFLRIPVDVPPLHEQGHGLESCIEGMPDHLRALRDQHRPGWIPAGSELRLRQPGVYIQLRPAEI